MPGWAMVTEAARGFFGYCVLAVCEEYANRTSCTNGTVEKAGRRGPAGAGSEWENSEVSSFFKMRILSFIDIPYH